MNTYKRPVTGGWWRHNPFYRWYMLREASCVVITIYAFILLTGLARLAQGQASYSDWLDGLASPWAIAFHAVAFALVAYHAWTWFKIMPKTLPRLPIPDGAIVAGGVAAIFACSALVLWAAL